MGIEITYITLLEADIVLRNIRFSFWKSAK